MHLRLTSLPRVSHVTMTAVESPRGNEPMTHRAEPHVNLRITESSLTNNLVMVQTRKTQQRNFQHFPAARLPQLGVDPRGKEKRRGIRVVKKVPIFGKVIFGPIFVIFRNEGQDFVHQSNSRFLFYKKPSKSGLPIVPRGSASTGRSRGTRSCSGDEFPRGRTSKAA